jgi:hypothetical protein
MLCKMGSVEKVDLPEDLCGENQWETVPNLELFEAAEKGDIGTIDQFLERFPFVLDLNLNDFLLLNLFL